jgi:hypothetical protein
MVANISKREYNLFVIESLRRFKEIQTNSLLSIVSKNSYNIVVDRFIEILTSNNEFGSEEYDEIKSLVHIADSLTSTINKHSEIEYDSEYNDLAFGYLYSILNSVIEYHECGFKD